MVPTVQKADGECQAKLEVEKKGRAWEGLWRGIGGAETRRRRED